MFTINKMEKKKKLITGFSLLLCHMDRDEWHSTFAQRKSGIKDRALHLFFGQISHLYFC